MGRYAGRADARSGAAVSGPREGLVRALALGWAQPLVAELWGQDRRWWRWSSPAVCWHVRPLAAEAGKQGRGVRRAGGSWAAGRRRELGHARERAGPALLGLSEKGKEAGLGWGEEGRWEWFGPPGWVWAFYFLSPFLFLINSRLFEFKFRFEFKTLALKQNENHAPA